MAVKSRYRLVNPLLGTFFGIFASAFAALVLLMLVFEQLGTSEDRLKLVLGIGPALLYLAIGVAAWTSEPEDYFACGRRVPEAFNGLVLAVTALGATGLVSLTGALFVIGFDALALLMGWTAGLVMMGVLVVPYFRKLGAYTVPSFLGRRLASLGVRVIAAVLLTVPMLLIVAAEIRLGARIAAWSLGGSERTHVLLGSALIVATVILGGMRSLTWSNVAQSIAALVALMVPVTIVSVLLTNLPIPQLTYGGVIKSLLIAEESLQLRAAPAPPLGLALPDEGLHRVQKPFVQPFSAIGRTGFLLLALTCMAGVMSMPALLVRSGTALGVYEARKSMGWAVMILGVMVLTLPAIAAFMRETVVLRAFGAPAEQVPPWLQILAQQGLAEVAPAGGRLTPDSIRISRDAILIALPFAAGFPMVLVHLAAVGIIAAALSAASARILALGNMLSEDVVHGLKWEPVPSLARLTVARLGLIAAAIAGGMLALFAPTDPLRLLIWAFSLAASTAFSVLILVVWWKRVNAWGAIAGMLAGFLVSAACIITGDAPWLGIDSTLAAVFGVPASLLAVVAVSLLTPQPSREEIERIHNMRMPGGETMYDRDQRLMRLQSRAKR